MSNKTTKSKTQNYNTITVTSCPELFPDSTWFSTTVDGTVADSNFDYTYSIGTIDQTPADEIEKAELKKEVQLADQNQDREDALPF